VLAFAAFSALRRGDVEQAKAWRATALDRATEAHQRLRVLDSAFVIAAFTDDVGAWLAIGEERVDLARATGDDYELARAVASCVGAYRARGDDATAVATEALEHAHRVGNPSGICSATMAAGQVLVDSDPNHAFELFAEAEHLAALAGNRSLASVVDGVRGFALYSSGATGAALRSSVNAMQVQLDVGFVSFIMGNVMLIIDAFVEAGRDEDAAVLSGFFRASGSGHAVKPIIVSPRSDLSVLPDRLGRARYDELAARGATFGYQAVIDFASEAVERFLAERDASAD
jgi:hypothetical protein